MLSEEANRERRITLFAAVYDGSREPGSTLKRTPRIELRFRNADDRAAIVRHRLFSNASTYDRDAARTVVRSYVNTWRKLGVETQDPYAERMEHAFPFLPDLIELVFERITESGGFQGTRSALGLLGAMLDTMDGASALMSAAHCKVTDGACTDRLQDLDPTGTLINCAASNQRDLAGQPFSEAIASTVLLASVVPGGGARGLGRDALVRHVAAPGADPNRLHAGMDAFSRFGTNFHEREGRFFFDSEENEHAKVELEAVKLNDEIARAEVVRLWQRDVFGDTRHSVVFQDPATTRQALDALERKPPRYVLAPRRLSAPERHGLYMGLERRNQVLLLEPRDHRTDHLANPDMLALARGVRAAAQLAEAASSGERRGRFERIARERTQEIVRLLKSAGLVYVRIDEWAETPDRTVFEEESLGAASTREEALGFLRTQLFPGALFEEHLRDRLDDLFDTPPLPRPGQAAPADGRAAGRRRRPRHSLRAVHHLRELRRPRSGEPARRLPRRPERHRKPRRTARDHRAGSDGQGRPGAALRAAPRRAGCGLRGTGPHRGAGGKRGAGGGAVMTTPVLTSRYLDQLTRPEPRLPGLSHWLLNEVWTEAAFEAAGRSPRTYLFRGERWMNAVENLMTAAGDRLYAELAEPPSEQVGIGRFMDENPDAAVVVFDGCSLREIPRLLQLGP